MKFSVPLRAESNRSSAFLDVLFLLWITFFLVTTLSEEDSARVEPAQVEVKLPVFENHEGAARTDEGNQLRLALGAEGSLSVDGEALGVGRSGRERLEERLRARPAGTEPPRVRLFTDEAARAEEFLPLVALLRERGIVRIDLLGVEPNEEGGR